MGMRCVLSRARRLVFRKVLSMIHRNTGKSRSKGTGIGSFILWFQFSGQLNMTDCSRREGRQTLTGPPYRREQEKWRCKRAGTGREGIERRGMTVRQELCILI